MPIFSPTFREVRDDRSDARAQGFLAAQSWDLSGDDKQSRLSGQYTVALSLGGGWQLVSGPPYSYNWATKKLTLPVGGGPFRTIIAGSTPIPDAGADRQPPWQRPEEIVA